MNEIVEESDLDFLLSLPDEEFNLYCNIPNGYTSDVDDCDENEDSDEINTFLKTQQDTEVEITKILEQHEQATTFQEEDQQSAQPEPSGVQPHTSGIQSTTSGTQQTPESTTSGKQQTQDQGDTSYSAESTQKKKTKPIYKFKKSSFEPPDTQWLGSLPCPPVEEISPLDYFKLFWDDALIDLLVYQSNLYAIQQGGSLQTNKNEMEQFISILLQMGIVKMPAMHMYWSNECRFSPVADTMSRNRFTTILRYFHIANNHEMPPRDENFDKLFKVRPLLNNLRSAMHDIPPEEYHAVDEQIIPFKGRSSLKQYVKNKPHKWGYKVFTRAGASGIMYDFEIYVGKNTCEQKGLGFSGDIVLTLSETLPVNQNFKLFSDNWFSSLPLSAALMDRGILFIGTARSDRIGHCPLKTEPDLKKCGRGSSDWRVETNSNTVVTRWYDRKAINFVSSYASIEPIGECRRYNASEKKFCDIPRPHVVTLYNKHMGGVDLADMLIELYRVNFKSRKWYMRIVYWSMAVGVVNSWLLYRRHCYQNNIVTKYTLLQFQSHIACSLRMVGKDVTTKKRGRPSSIESETVSQVLKRSVCVMPEKDVRLDGMHHMPDLVDKKDRCKLCQSTTQMKCKKCNINLCLTKERKCFQIFHCE